MDVLEPIVKGYQIGVDVGQQVDPTAIIVTELQLRNYQRIPDDYTGRYSTEGGEIHYVVRYIDRLELRTPYPKIIDKLKQIYEGVQTKTLSRNIPQSIEDRLLKRERRTPALHFECYVDATGVGRPVVDAMEKEGMRVRAVTLTGGEKETWDGDEVRLAKEILVSRMQMVLQNKQVHFPDAPPEQAYLSQIVSEELLNYEIRVTEGQNLKMGVFKTGAHDDLATALGLACWEMRDTTVYIEHLKPGDPLYEVLYGRR